MPLYNPVSTIRVQQFLCNLNQGAGTYAFATGSIGLVDIIGIELYNDVAAAGLTSIIMASDDTTPVNILASTLLAALTGGKLLTSLVTVPFVLPAGKHLNYTIVGIGSAGSVQAIVRYMSPSGGTLS